MKKDKENIIYFPRKYDNLFTQTQKLYNNYYSNDIILLSEEEWHKIDTEILEIIGVRYKKCDNKVYVSHPALTGTQKLNKRIVE